MTSLNTSPTLQAKGVRCIFLIGFMGSGKTHWGRRWAAANQLDFLDLDDLIEKNAKKTIAQIFEADGEDRFREMEAAALRSCDGMLDTIVACGGGTPCFLGNMQWMNDHGITIYFSAMPEEIYKRVLSEQAKRPLIKELNNAELYSFIEQKLTERHPVYSQAQLIVQSCLLTEDSLPAIIANTLS